MNEQLINEIGQNIANLKDNNINQNIAQNTIHQYIPDKYPPDIEFARNHGKAKRVAKPIDKLEEDLNKSSSVSIIRDVCECCGLPIENELLPLCCDRIELADFGSGYPLYFEFVFYCIIMLILMFLAIGIYAIVSNYKAGDCESLLDIISCSDLNKISIPNKVLHADLYYVQTWVNLGAIIVIMISLHKFRRVQKLTENECDRGLVSPSDYTIMISKLPPGKYNEEDIKRLILEKIPHASDQRDNIQIKKIVLAYNISQFIENCRGYSSTNLKIRKAKQYEKKHGKLPDKVNLENFEKEALFFREKIQIFKQEMQNENGMNGMTCGDAFVTFSTQMNTHEILGRYEFSSFRKYTNIIKQWICCDKTLNDNKLHFQDTLLYVKRAPEPNDVIWENLGFSLFFRFKRRVFTNLATLIVLAICFLMNLGISTYQSSVADDYAKYVKANDTENIESKKAWVKTLGYLSSFLIVFINTCLLLCIRKFASVEKHSTITHLDISVAEKLSFAQFCNTALITFVANYLIYCRDASNKEIFKEGGLITDLFSIFLSNAFIPILTTYFNPWYGLRLYKRYKIEKEGKDSFVTQAEANEIYEGGPLDMAYKYGILIKTMWMTSFYACIMPIGIVFSLANLILTYLLDKYLILRRYARTPLLSSDLNRSMIESLEYCPFLMALGSLFFHSLLYDPKVTDMVADFIALGLTCINFIFPAAEFNDCVCKTDDEPHDTTTYDEAMRKFATDYDRANPITQEKAMNEWVTLVEGSQALADKQNNERLNTVDALENWAVGNNPGNYNNIMQHMILKKNVQRKSLGGNKIFELKKQETENLPQENINISMPPPQNINPQGYPQQNIGVYPNINQGVMMGQPSMQPGYYPPSNIYGQPPPGQNYY